jgi:hypothetical protein
VELQLGENGNIKYCINKGTDAHLPILKKIANGDSWSVSGDENIARHLVRVSSAANAQSLYGDADTASQIDQWLSVFDRSTCVASVRDSLVTLANTHLSDKAYFVGSTLTLADIAIWTALRKLAFVPAFETAPHVSRWFELVSGTIPWSPIVVSVAPPAIPAATAGSAENAPKKGAAASNSNSTTAAAADADAEEAGGAQGSCPPLEGAVEGQVCTRFPPEPSGYLHIGEIHVCLIYDSLYNDTQRRYACLMSIRHRSMLCGCVGIFPVNLRDVLFLIPELILSPSLPSLCDRPREGGAAEPVLRAALQGQALGALRRHQPQQGEGRVPREHHQGPGHPQRHPRLGERLVSVLLCVLLRAVCM